MDRRTLLLGSAALGVATAAPALAQVRVPRFWLQQWPNTDFSRSSVPFEEIISGGVPRDAIPALNGARFAGAEGLGPREPVVTVALEGSVERAYPIRYLIWHEIVNDSIDGVPVAVTFCPLCNSVLVFDRRLDGVTYTFGVSGNLRFSDMVMFDRETESWWQQFTGEGIVGEMTGAQLDIVLSWMEPLEAFLERNPGGPVMQEPTGYRRAYGRNPYVGYDGAAQPFLYRGEQPPHDIPPLSRVVRVGDRAWPLSRFAGTPVIEEAGVRIEWQGGMTSALDGPKIAESRDIGAIRVYDAATGADVIHEVVFAFAFHAFAPEGEWMLGGGG